jgi:hypothetical protein
MYDEIVKRVKSARYPAGFLRPKIPRLVKQDNKTFTVQGLSLVFFYSQMGKIVDKTDLVRFLKRMHVSTTDPQPRHLGMQHGFYFLVSGCVHPVTRRVLKRGQYCLVSLNKPHPARSSTDHRVVTVTTVQFERLKKKNHYRCASCGSMEGFAHFKNPLLKTRLEKGHMDPRKKLDLCNCLPMCSMCNSIYRNRAIFAKNGIIKKFLL